MFIGPRIGRLVEPLDGRIWDCAEISRRLRSRVAWLKHHGLSVSDRVFIHYGNTPEIFIDLLAIWNLGGCAIPVDPQLTGFELETMAGVAAPRFSLWLGPLR
jgi:acyl-CoA synthetase (AMP-forming)/AMP-acid ligase II